MKKLLAVFFSALFLFCLSACGKHNETEQNATNSTTDLVATTTAGDTTATTTDTEAATTTTESTTTTTTTAKPTTTSTSKTTTTTTTTTAKSTTTTKKTTTTKTTTTTKKDTSTTTAKQIGWIDGAVQAADPETGISWDGKSPIVYTYEDGTTGTTPKNNALYEELPGEYVMYVESPNSVYDGICDWCGKVKGDGSDGTCAIHAMFDECKLCGASGILNKCHTCKE